MPMRHDTNCSELEYLVMAMIESDITSGYAMRKHMNRMRGGHWSTESGSIYRALKRLQEGGLIELAGKAGAPNRQRTEYRLTGQGRTELDHWLRGAMHPDQLETLNDPVRSRSYFLGLLDPPARENVVRSWISGTKNLIESIKYDLERHNGDAATLERLSLQGYLAVTNARLEWLKMLLQSLKSVN